MAEHAQPPGLPAIVDEAADTPAWVPRLGLALLIAAVLYAVFGSNPAHNAATPARAPSGAPPAPTAAAPP